MKAITEKPISKSQGHMEILIQIKKKGKDGKEDMKEEKESTEECDETSEEKE